MFHDLLAMIMFCLSLTMFLPSQPHDYDQSSITIRWCHAVRARGGIQGTRALPGDRWRLVRLESFSAMTRAAPMG